MSNCGVRIGANSFFIDFFATFSIVLKVPSEFFYTPFEFGPRTFRPYYQFFIFEAKWLQKGKRRLLMSLDLKSATIQVGIIKLIKTLYPSVLNTVVYFILPVSNGLRFFGGRGGEMEEGGNFLFG
jgi:hypothetical protein